MRLQIGTFPVKDVQFGSRIRWHNGILELNHDELLALVLAEPDIANAKIEVAKPGESARIINYYDILEPRIKVAGHGVVYPGKCGRPVDAVGTGVTHRLEGSTVIACVDDPGFLARGGWKGVEQVDAPKPSRTHVTLFHRFVDMSGPGAVLPYASTHNVCLSVRLREGLNESDRANVTLAALLRLSDKLAETTKDLEPPEVEVFDVSEKDPSLPNVVFICLLASFEARNGPRSPAGTAVYGVTRLSAPWVLAPTEFMDGAVTGGLVTDVYGEETWPLINNPIVRGLCRRHGKTLNFLACIVGRTNWGEESEMELAADRCAQAALLLGAEGAIVTNDIRGRRFVDSVHTIQACERRGIKTVFVSEEEDSEDGNAPPFLYHPSELAAAVSTGSGAVGPFAAVDRVIGGLDGVSPGWYGEQPPIPGRYGANHIRDHYGVNRQSHIDY